MNPSKNNYLSLNVRSYRVFSLGKSYSKKAPILGVSKSTVSRNIKKYSTHGTVKNLNKLRCSKIKSGVDIEVLEKISSENPKTCVSPLSK